MSAQLVRIGDVDVQQIFYKEKPVVTIETVASVHKTSRSNVQKSFSRHQARFKSGKHFYRLEYSEVKSLGLLVPANSNGLILFTEKGYLLLVKPMENERAWEVQEQMVDEYFAMREALQDTATQQAHVQERVSANDPFALKERQLQLLKDNATFIHELGGLTDERKQLFVTQALLLVGDVAGPQPVAPEEEQIWWAIRDVNKIYGLPFEYEYRLNGQRRKLGPIVKDKYTRRFQEAPEFDTLDKVYIYPENRLWYVEELIYDFYTNFPTGTKFDEQIAKGLLAMRVAMTKRMSMNKNIDATAAEREYHAAKIRESERAMEFGEGQTGER